MGGRARFAAILGMPSDRDATIEAGWPQTFEDIDDSEAPARCAPVRLSLIVSGVVHSCGALGSGLDDDWALTFALQPWRILGGPLHLGRLPMRWRVPRGSARRLAERLGAYNVLSLRVSSLQPLGGAEVVDVHQLRRADMELARWAMELRRIHARERVDRVARREATAAKLAPLVQQTERNAAAMNDVVVVDLWGS
jgi:hypothetical protein